jgi:hypothetical protein
MDKEEFERLKEEEKRHLREMRALKQQYREAQRKRGVLDALKGMMNPEADATHEEMLDRLSRQNVESEARFEVAFDAAGLSEEDAARRAREEADREAVRKAEAEALVRQMKQQMGDPSGAASEPARAEGRTIGRVAPPEEGERPAEDARGAKTIGRQRQGE